MIESDSGSISFYNEVIVEVVSLLESTPMWQSPGSSTVDAADIDTTEGNT
jgi:hypothetical protein